MSVETRPSPNGSPRGLNLMFRAGLAVYLSLVLLAGPGACCCTSTRLTGYLAGFGAGKVLPQEHALPSCCRQNSAEPDRVPSGSPSPGKPKPAEKTPCPCEHCCLPQLAIAGPGVADISVQGHFTAFQLDGPDALFVHDSNFSLPGSQSSSFWKGGGPLLSAQELLRAHHNLLC
jgi:hypothetical protein